MDRARRAAPAIACMLALACALLPAAALAEPSVDAKMTGEQRDAVDAGLQSIDISLWREYYAKLPEAARELFGADGIDGMLRGFMGEAALESGSDGLFDALGGMFKEALRECIGSFSLIMCAAFLSGIFGVLTGGAESAGLRELAAFSCFALCAASIAYTVSGLVDATVSTVDALSGFVEIITPVAVTVLAMAGNASASGMISPTMGFLTGTVVTTFKNAVLPLVVLGATVAVINGLMGRVKLDKLFAFVKSALKWLIGAVFTVYLGMVSVRGLSAGIIDSVTLRTAKYTIDKSLPIIGGAASGTLEQVLGSASILKGALGLAGVLTVAATVLLPLVRIGSACLCLRLTAALCEPVSDPRLPKLLCSVADVCNYLFASVTAVGIMAIISLGIVAAAGGA